MKLAIPLLIMIAALAMAWGLGWAARGRSDAVRWGLAAAGVASLFVLPLVYEAATFDGSCYANDGAASPCTLSERLSASFADGFAYIVPPAIMWLVAFAFSARLPR